MGRTLRRLAAVCLIAAVMFTVPVTANARPTDRRRAAFGAAYLAAAQQPDGSLPAFSPIGSTADAVLAFVSAGVGPRPAARALAYLEAQTRAGNIDTVGLRAKVALAASAMGRDPRHFAGHNLVFEIRGTQAGTGRFGNGTASVLDQALAILAFRGAGTRASHDALAWLRAAQCPDGGWAFDEPYAAGRDNAHCRSKTAPSSDYFLSDTNTTSYVVQALEASGNAPLGAEDPFGFFSAIRDPKHLGWGYTWGYRSTDANSTALALQAYAAAGRATPHGALAALRRLQPAACGGWAFTWNGDTRGPVDVGATIGAVPGVVLAAFPVHAGTLRALPHREACV